MHYYFSVLKKCAVFAGRASRAEYWYFILFNFIVVSAISLIWSLPTSFGLNIVYNIANIILSTAVGVRRMHDVNKSGWYILVPIYSLVLLLTRGTTGGNKYGPDPKEI